MLREKFALTERGAFEFKRGAFFCALANLVMMAPIGVLCMATNDYLDHLLDPSKPLPALGGYLAAIVVILLLMLLTQWLEYHFTYNVVYGESARKRIELAEVLRRLPLSFFGRRDLSDLTTTIMKDCADQERMFSHIMPLLFGTGASTILISIMLLLFNWKMAIAALWVLPIALLIIAFSRKSQDAKGQFLIDRQLDVADGLQEYLECAQEITAANQSETYLEQLDQKIDRAEKAQIVSELSSAVPVSAAQAFLKLGIASTVLVGALLLASGELEFMVYFCFLLVVTRFYDPINTVLEVVTELLNLKLGIKRMHSIEHERVDGIRAGESRHFFRQRDFFVRRRREGSLERLICCEGGRGDRLGRSERGRQVHRGQAGCPFLGCRRWRCEHRRRGRFDRRPRGPSRRFRPSVPGCGSVRRHDHAEHPTR